MLGFVTIEHAADVDLDGQVILVDDLDPGTAAAGRVAVLRAVPDQPERYRLEPHDLVQLVDE